MESSTIALLLVFLALFAILVIVFCHLSRRTDENK